MMKVENKMIRQSSRKEPVSPKKPRTKENPIRVLTVDDSALMRLTLSRHLNQFSNIKVIGQASNGYEMLSMVEESPPDVVVLDIEMPEMNGLEALDQLMRIHPLPVIMLSHLTDATLQALELGAVDFVVKPQPGVTIAETVNTLVEKIYHAVDAKVEYRPKRLEERVERRGAISSMQDVENDAPKRVSPLELSDTLLAVASSTGGPSALTAFFSAIPAGLALGGVIVQHMPVGFTTILSQRLNRIAGYKVIEATNGARLMRGQFLLAPGGFHLTFDRHGVASLNEGPTVNGVRPAADVTFNSMAAAFGARMTVVVLTGMGNDGFVGATEIHRRGGRILAQDEKSAVVFGMPRRIVESNMAEYVATPALLGAYLADKVVR